MNSSGGTHILRSRKHRNSGSKFPWNKHSGNTSPVNFRQGSPKTQFSARKLAAGLWQFRFKEVSPFPHGSFHFSNSQSQLECSKEEMTERSPAFSEAANVYAKIHSKKLLKQRKLRGDSVVSALIPELLRCINKLKAEHNSSKKKLQQLVRNLEEEKVLWKHREAQKIQAMLDDLKDKLAREKRSRERMELLNTKLVHELAEAKLYAKQFMINYKEEKKERELMEEVCNELAMQIGEDKAKLEEVEEERKMFQMAGLWREESMQMKLVDAKLALEDKYNQMIQLIAYLQTFLRSRGDELDTVKLREAQLIKQAAESVNVQCITQLSYDFSKSNENFPIYEELRKGKINERVIKPDSLSSSTIHIVSLDEDYLNNNNVLHQASSSSDYSTGLEVTNSREPVNQVEDQDFCSTPQGRGTFLYNVNYQDKNILGSEAECCENTDLESLKTGVNGALSVSMGKLKLKAFSASELLRSCQRDGTANSAPKTCQYRRPDYGCYKHHDSMAQQNSEDLTFDECKGRFTRGSFQSGGITSTFMCKGSGEGCFKQWELLGQGNSTNTMNPHITRGMKGRIEWRRGISKTNSKAIPLEERVRKQKSQLQLILKQQA